jgi:glycosyltransferase involved in cell wall biosynthesis
MGFTKISKIETPKNMTTQNPKVSIGLPVFNGERYLTEAIDSILSQTFTDFEIIISDNASTDRTEEICREYADRDSRIRYHRNATNIGGSRNENLTIQLARGEYFHIGADDDLLAPELLAKCVEVLDNDPSLVLCYSNIFHIDEHGRSLGKIEPEDLATSIEPDERFRDLLKPHRVDFLYGLIRTDILHKTELEPPYPESDLIFGCELGLYGRFYKIPEYLFYRRTHAEAFTTLDLDRRMFWTQPQMQNVPKWLMPFWVQFYGHFGLFWLELSHLLRIIWRTPLTPRERISCLSHSSRWLSQKFFVAKSWKFRQKLFLSRESVARVRSLFKIN